jgi:hypothetical protein
MLTLKVIRANTIEDKANEIALISVFSFAFTGFVIALCFVFYYFRIDKLNQGSWIIILYFPLLILCLGLVIYSILTIIRQGNHKNDRAIWDDKLNKMRIELSYGNKTIEREEIIRAVLFETKTKHGTMTSREYKSEQVLGLELKNNKKFILAEAEKGNDFKGFIKAMTDNGIGIINERDYRTPDLSYFLKKYPQTYNRISMKDIKGATDEEQDQDLLNHFTFQTDRTPLAMAVVLFLVLFIPCIYLTFNSRMLFFGYLVIWIFVLLGVLLIKDHPDILLTSRGLFFVDVSLAYGTIRKRAYISYDDIMGISLDGTKGTRVTISAKDGHKYSADATSLDSVRLVERVLFQLNRDSELKSQALDKVLYGNGWTRSA